MKDEESVTIIISYLREYLSDDCGPRVKRAKAAINKLTTAYNSYSNPRETKISRGSNFCTRQSFACE